MSATEGRAGDAPNSDALEPLTVFVEASGKLLGALSEEKVLDSVLDLYRRLLGAQACAVWRAASEQAAWRIIASFGLSDQFRSIDIDPHRSFRQLDQEYLYTENVERDPILPERLALYRHEGIAAWIAVPLRVHGRLSGTITAYYADPRRFTPADLRLTCAIANMASSALSAAELYEEQRENRERAERARRQTAFLAEAGAMLASSLDYRATLASVARLAVPWLADWCTVDVVTEDGTLKQVVLAHVDPSKIAWAEALNRRYPPRPDAPGGPPRVVRTGHSEMLAEIPDELLAVSAHDAAHLKLMRQIGCTSYLCVPLAARGRTLGALTFVMAESGRRYTSADLALAEDLARRAALAVDNARLYSAADRERAAAQQALEAFRENERRLRMALDAGRMAIWEREVASGKLRSTDNLETLHGFPPGAFAGAFDSFVASIDPQDRPGFVASMERAIRERSHFEADYRVTSQDGTVHWMSGKAQVYTDDEGEPTRLIGLAIDISERRRLEEKLRNAQKLESIGLLAGGVAHDFNNLLTGMLGNASLAAELLPPDSEAQPLLANVIAATERAADLTHQLLAYSGKGRFVVQSVDVSAVVREMASLLGVTLPRQVSLRLDLSSALPFIEADATQIQQVVMNLVINAAEAMDERGGEVAVRTSALRITGGPVAANGPTDDLAPGGYVCVEVEDTGSGITPDVQARIFDPFFTTKFTGRGLGLAAVAGIVRSHHGAIHVDSTPGRGTTFRVLLPAAAGRAEGTVSNGRS